jgi:hypothetical protein
MRSQSIVVPSPLLDQDGGLFECVEDLPAQELVPQLPDERLDVSVLPRTARLVEQRPHAQSSQPVSERPGAELRAVVRPEMRRNAPADEQVRLGVQNIVGVDSLTTPYFCRSHNLQDTAIRTMRSSLCGNRCRTRNCRYVREGGALVGYLGSPRRRNVNQSAKQKPA